MYRLPVQSVPRKTPRRLLRSPQLISTNPKTERNKVFLSEASSSDEEAPRRRNQTRRRRSIDRRGRIRNLRTRLRDQRGVRESREGNEEKEESEQTTEEKEVIGIIEGGLHRVKDRTGKVSFKA